MDRIKIKNSQTAKEIKAGRGADKRQPASHPIHNSLSSLHALKKQIQHLILSDPDFREFLSSHLRTDGLQ